MTLMDYVQSFNSNIENGNVSDALAELYSLPVEIAVAVAAYSVDNAMQSRREKDILLQILGTKAYEKGKELKL